MTLRARLIAGSTLTGFCLLTVAIATVIALGRFSRDVGLINEEYEERAAIGAVRERVFTAHAFLHGDTPDTASADHALEEAGAQLRAFIAEQSSEDISGAEHQAAERSLAEEILAAIGDIRAHLSDEPGELGDGLPSRDAEFIQIAERLAALLADADAQVSHASQASARRVRLGLMLFVAITGIAFLIGIVAAAFTYRSVMRPVRELRDQIRKTSIPLRGERVASDSADEITSIRSDFVDVVNELNALYRTLEDRVNTKSRELVRSERLASVGYLAAGIAHEINNPLSSISGYSELVRKQLGQAEQPEQWAEAVDSLGIIYREAMRCKGITDRLLSLSRKASEAKGPVDLFEVAQQTTDLVMGLPHLSGRTIENRIADRDTLVVWGVAAELVQVLLNLVVNAIEACQPKSGHVTIAGKRLHSSIELTVTDNGAGMAPDVVEHLFEPFFTNKRGQQAVGTGLGMSIVHAIVQDYGGRVEAQSPGPGQGATLTVTFPAYQEVYDDNELAD